MAGDKIYNTFLKRQLEDGMRLASESDILELVPAPGDPPDRYAAVFHCKGLVKDRDGTIREADTFAAQIWFPPEYLRHAEPAQIITWLGPVNVFHPNVRPPFVCAGRLPPATRLVDLLDQLHQIITYNKAHMADNGLNAEASAWARRNADRFPIDSRPLKRRRLDIRVRVTGKAVTP